MTTRRIESKVKKIVEGIQQEGEVSFKLAIINIDDVENKDHQGEALVQVVLNNRGNSRIAVPTFLYYKKTGKKEEVENKDFIYQNKDVRKLVYIFKKEVPEEIKQEAGCEVVDMAIISLIIKLYKEKKRDYKREVL
jgi:hypothetical protein